MDLIDITGTKKSDSNANTSSSVKSGASKKVLSLNCPNCGFTFFDEKSLSEHMRIHAIDAAVSSMSSTTDFMDFLVVPTSVGAAPVNSSRKQSMSKTIKPSKTSSHRGLFSKHKTVNEKKMRSASFAYDTKTGHASGIESQPMQLIKPVRVLSELESIIIVQSLARRWLVKRKMRNECKYYYIILYY